jgi:hypothetical protein
LVKVLVEQLGTTTKKPEGETEPVERVTVDTLMMAEILKYHGQTGPDGKVHDDVRGLSSREWEKRIPRGKSAIADSKTYKELVHERLKLQAEHMNTKRQRTKHETTELNEPKYLHSGIEPSLTNPHLATIDQQDEDEQWEKPAE